MSRTATLIATVGGIGRLPQAPGTFASLLALPLAWMLHAVGGFPLLAMATLGVFGMGINAVGLYPGGENDPPEVVVDEIVGQWIALWPLSLGLWWQGFPGDVFPWPGWVLAFLAFRFFDILKPPPIRRIENIPGAWGVMLDDVMGGLMAALVGSAAAIVAHGVLM